MPNPKQENNNTNRDELMSLIKSRVERLRPKLLDLGRRNPLLATKFSDRSHSHIRVVDDLPQILYNKLIDNKMCFDPLPPLEKDPKDEDTIKFQKALADARITDKLYNETLENIDHDSNDSADKLEAAERDLKDRLRELLGMPARQTKQDLSLVQHAKNHDILPFYDLPLPEDKNKDGRHVDDLIQTLLLPDFLQKKLNSLMNKHRIWVQETGIDVLRAGFGFLEWTESSSPKSSLAPLVLLPVEIEKKKTRKGFEYWVSAQGDAPETNTVLVEKLKRDFGIELPSFNAETADLEEYFKEVGQICKNELSWKIRRQVAIGVFPSARMAMYHDLNTENWDFEVHDVIQKLLGDSSANSSGALFGDEYEIDDPDIEVKVPLLVMDADSSQHSVIVDIMDKKNLAVEGPPGTGKSQTIVNTIAVALNSGKKVLFVAEKMAALEVVRSRLEACGLGEFLLTLQAIRSSKEQVIQSIRQRVSMRNERDPEELDEKIRQFKSARTQINRYIEIISSRFSDTTFTVHQILGWGMKAHELLGEIGLKQKNIKISNLEMLTKEDLDDTFQICNQLEDCWLKTNSLPKSWSFIKKGDMDPYTAEEILLATKRSAELYHECNQQRLRLFNISLSDDLDREALLRIKGLLDYVSGFHGKLNISFIKRVVENNALSKLNSFFEESSRLLVSRRKFDKYLIDPMDVAIPEKLTLLDSALLSLGIDTPSESEANIRISELEEVISSKSKAKSIIEGTSKIIPNIKEYSIPTIISFLDVASTATKDILSLRSDSFLDADSKESITNSAKKAKSLLDEQKSLKEIFYVIDTMNREEIEESIKVFTSSGFFAIFSPKYRKTKRFFKSIVTLKSFKKEQAIKHLRRLNNWLYGVQEFCGDTRIKKYIGDHFAGIKTDFLPYIQLLEFYDKIDQKLMGLEYSDVRKFLHNGVIGEIIDLPRIEEEHPIRYLDEKNLKEVVNTIASLEKKLNLFKESRKLIIDSSNFLNPDSELYVKQLGKLSFYLKSFQDKWKELENDSFLRSILNEEFKGPMLLPVSLKDSFSLIPMMEVFEIELKKIILSLIKTDQINNNLEIINDVIASDITAEKSLTEICELVNVDFKVCFGSSTHKELIDFLLKASTDKEGLIAHSYFFSTALEVSSKGCGEIIEKLLEMPKGLKELSKIVDAFIGEALAKLVYSKFGSTIAKYNGIKLDKLRKQISELDREILKLSRKRLRSKLRSHSYPPLGLGSGRRSEWTDMALLNNEIEKKKRFLPARELTKRASKALLELKPCWMMSPLAVAQYIEKGDINFDLLIIDEASQMTPENSLGAIARASQVMVVGDTNQLPPSSFFKKFIDTLDDEEEEDNLTEESILEMANSVFRPVRRLRWHYRSKRPNLISFCNKYVYDNDLIVFPSPNIDAFEKSVCFHKVNGLYSSGTNPVEASELVKAIIDFMHNNKNMSLGVVLLNQRQRDLVTDEWEYMMSQDATAQAYVEYWQTKADGLETFFIKNLENVQGDQRDVIFIGTVYGPEKEGAPVMQRFGPINGISGKRRLNVLFSRAKHKIVTFSSMTSSDIRVDSRSNEGVELLKNWLEYCASGQLLCSEITHRKPESVFEEYVISQLKSFGCQPIPQIGVSGYFIDIGIKHPKWPHGFIMGVECDGATYHSSKSTRDRDRLRQEVLEGLGWHLYRIWSTDWFTDPIGEAERLRLAIENRLCKLNENGVKT